MNKTLKSLFVVILCFFALISISDVFAASSSTGQNISVTVNDSPVVVPETPTIIRSENIATNALDLVVEVGNSYASETLNFVVTVTNTFSGVVSNVNLTQSSDVNARSTLHIPGLEPGTEYDFTVRYARPSGTYSADSDPHTAVTRIDSPVLDFIDSVTTDSADLHVIVDPAFIGSTMDFVIEIKNGSTYTVQTTENISGSRITLKIDGLDPETNYTFKVKYARKDTAHFSDYSNSKSITTDAELNTPVIEEIRDITTNSMDLVVKIKDQANEKLNFTVRVTNKVTGTSYTLDFNETVGGDELVILGIGGLDPGTEYEFVVKYALDGETTYSNYSDPKTASTTYTDGGGDDSDTTPGGNTDGGTDTVSGGSTDIGGGEGEKTRKDEMREKIIPESAKGNYQTASIVGAAAGTAIALAGAALPLFAAMPGAFGSSIFIKLMELFGIIGRRKEDRNWGVVFERETHMPIPAVKIVLLDLMGKEMATTYSDQDGRYGFLVDPGNYVIDVFKKDFTFLTDLTNDNLYGKVYDGKTVEVHDDHIIAANIAMKAENIDWNEYSQKRISQYKFSVFLKYFFIGIYILGFSATLVITYFYPSMFNFIVLGIYILFLIYRIFFKKKKYGSVETNNGKPIPFAVVNIYDKTSNEKRNFAVTDAVGRYYLLTENGSYDLTAKGQPVSGTPFEKRGEVRVRDGIVRKDVIV